ncbi:MAG: hypothetical protein LBG99_07695 [Propionibacteriaceae bacterium]|nr:hypothetical protein [Propionibacteriaceae bacterium]
MVNGEAARTHRAQDKQLEAIRILRAGGDPLDTIATLDSIIVAGGFAANQAEQLKSELTP